MATVLPSPAPTPELLAAVAQTSADPGLRWNPAAYEIWPNFEETVLLLCAVLPLLCLLWNLAVRILRCGITVGDRLSGRAVRAPSRTPSRSESKDLLFQGSLSSSYSPSDMEGGRAARYSSWQRDADREEELQIKRRASEKTNGKG